MGAHPACYRPDSPDQRTGIPEEANTGST